VILLDANILLYAYDRGSIHNEFMKAWLDDRLNGVAKVGIPWATTLAFARIVTNPRIYTSPVASSTAWQQARAWLSAPAAWVPQPTERHIDMIDRIISSTSVQANDIPDVHLGALAIEHGLKLCSTDADFAKYADVTWINPLDERQEEVDRS